MSPWIVATLARRLVAAILPHRRWPIRRHCRMPEPATLTRYTDPDWWDSYWQGLELPTEVRNGDGGVVDAILDVFDRYLPASDSALEIGGSSGRYLVYLYRTRGMRPLVLE